MPTFNNLSSGKQSTNTRLLPSLFFQATFLKALKGPGSAVDIRFSIDLRFLLLPWGARKSYCFVFFQTLLPFPPMPYKSLARPLLYNNSLLLLYTLWFCLSCYPTSLHFLFQYIISLIYFFHMFPVTVCSVQTFSSSNNCRTQGSARRWVGT